MAEQPQASSQTPPSQTGGPAAPGGSASSATPNPANVPSASTGIHPTPPATPGRGAARDEEDWVRAARTAGAPMAAFEPSDESADDRDEQRARINDPEAQQEKDEENYIYVESGRGDDRTALYERDPMHPNGEVFVGPGEVVQVSRTASVLSRLDSGDLVEADQGKFDEQEKARQETRDKVAAQQAGRDKLLASL